MYMFALTTGMSSYDRMEANRSVKNKSVWAFCAHALKYKFYMAHILHIVLNTPLFFISGEPFTLKVSFLFFQVAISP